MAAPAKVLRFDRREAYLEWEARENEERAARIAAEKEFASILLLWSDGRAWLGRARAGTVGPYAIAISHAPDTAESTRYIPRELFPRGQPKTPQEAVEAVRAEEARVIALWGEPDVTRNVVTAADGDPERVAALATRISRLESRHFAEWEFVKQFRLLALLWGPVYRWRRRRFMRREWTA